MTNLVSFKKYIFNYKWTKLNSLLYSDHKTTLFLQLFQRKTLFVLSKSWLLWLTTAFGNVPLLSHHWVCPQRKGHDPCEGD